MPSIGIVTMTLVREPKEARVLLEALATLGTYDLPIAVTDGGSPPEFLDALRRLPQIHLAPEPTAEGLLAQVRTSVRAARAWGTPRLLYTEPDKPEFFRQALGGFLAAVSDHEADDVILASRSPASFETYPPTQRRTERALNRLCAELTGVDTDYSYGPFAAPSTAFDGIEALAAGIGWGWRPYFFVASAARGHRISPVQVDASCPSCEPPAEAAEAAYRRRQLAQNLSGVAQAVADAGLAPRHEQRRADSWKHA
jgi:hypothetical protein